MMGKPVEATGVSADRETTSDHQSGGRSAMVGGHMKSNVPLDHPEPSQHFTGADFELAKYLFNDIAEHPGQVYIYEHGGKQRRAVFERRGKLGDSRVLERTIFYRRTDTLEKGLPYIDVINFGNYTEHDHVFSSEKKPSEKMMSIIRGETIDLAKGDILTDMPCVVGCEYADGVHLETITTSCQEVIEDAYTISDYAGEKMHSSGIAKISMVMADDEYLIDSYGRYVNGEYIPGYFPEVGQAIRNDGLVIAARRYDPLFAAIDMTASELRTPDPFFDRCEYVDADKRHYENPTEETGSRVVDIRVFRDETQCRDGNNDINVTEENKNELDKYALATKGYYKQLVEFYFSVKEQVVWSPKCYDLLSAAFASEVAGMSSTYEREIQREIEHMLRNGEMSSSDTVSSIFNKVSTPVDRTTANPIRNYTIEIVVRYPLPVTISSKITDRSGAKGVVGDMKPVDRMPLSEDGTVRVHVMRPANAVIRRSTYGGIFHIYWAAASEECKKTMKPMLDAGKTEEAWELFMDYVACYNPGYANILNETHPTTKEREALFKEIYDYQIRIFLPHELPNTAVGITVGVRSKYPPKKTRLWITRDDGSRVLTKNKFYVGKLETMRLDKTGREFSSISSMHLNYMGMIDATNHRRGSYPIMFKPIKWPGEAERRLFEAFARGLYIEIHDRSNNPEVARTECRGLMTSPTPSNPGHLIDRTKLPLGDSQVNRFINAAHTCEGFVLVKPERTV